MEEKKTIFNYIRQAFATYGIIVLVFVVFNILLGDVAGDYSALFALGKDGMSIPVLLELLLLAIMITFAQVLFLTDKWIENMSMIIRYVLFFGTVMIVMIVMIIVFNWIPIGDMYAWGGFVISYTVSMITSALLTRLKERTENSKMQEALDKYNRR